MLLDQKEIMVIHNAMLNVINELDWELTVRTGYDKEEIMNLFERINSNNKLSKTNDFLIVSQVLNEVCNGYELINFESMIGENRDFAITLLEKIDNYIQSLT